MTTNEARKTLTDLKFFLDELENKVLKLMDVIYEVEEKICDMELKEFINTGN